MKVCIVNDHFRMGGAEKVIIELANALAQLDYSINLIDFSGMDFFYYKVDDRITIEKVIRRRNLKRKLITYSIKKASKLKKKVTIQNIFIESS